MWKAMPRQWLLAAVFLVAAGPAAATGQEANESVAPSSGLGGDWFLNRALSDDPDDQLRRVRGAAPPPRRMGGGRPSDSSSLDAVRRAMEGFVINQTDSTVTITYPDRELVLFTDGRKQKIQISDDREAEYRAWWEAGQLFIERKLDGGVTATEQYSLQGGTGRLHVLTRLEGDPLPRTISFMRVYDPSEPDSER